MSRSTERIVARFAMLHEISLKLQQAGRQFDLAKTIAQHAPELLDACAARYLWLEAHADDPLLCCWNESTEKDYLHFDPAQGIAGKVLQEDIIYNCSDASADGYFVPLVDGRSGVVVDNVLAVPVRSENRTLGVLQVFNSKSATFEEIDSEWLCMLADHLGMAQTRLEVRDDGWIMATELSRSLADLLDGLRGQAGHTFRMVQMSLNVAQAMHLGGDLCKQIEFAALFKNLGGIAVANGPTGLDDKPPTTPLFPINELLKQAFLQRLRLPERLKSVLDIVALSQGEVLPHRTATPNILLAGRIVAVVSAFDLLTGGGIALSKENAIDGILEMLRQHMNTALDLQVIETIRLRKCYVIERRRFPRQEHPTPAEISLLDERFQCDPETCIETQALSLSECGMMFETTNTRIVRRSFLDICLHLPSQQIHAMGVVARVSPTKIKDVYQVGVDFVSYRCLDQEAAVSSDQREQTEWA